MKWLRLLAILAWLVPGLILTTCLWLLRLGGLSLGAHLRVAQWWYRGLLAILGVQVQVAGPQFSNPRVLVSNHISWLDILVLGSIEPCCFVSKIEVRRWPLIGFLAASIGTVFIRRGQGDTERVVSEMHRPIQQRVSVLFFPEGTTTTGESIRRFHRRLFALAQHTQVPVQPLALRYQFNPQPHPVVPFVNQQSLWDNLMALLSWGQPVVVIVQRLPCLPASTSRNELASLSQQAVANALIQMPKRWQH